MRKIVFGILGICAGILAAQADVPAGYYNSLEGKQGAELKAAVAALSTGHTVISYNTKTWSAFEKTDVRMVEGRQAWYDMYSNNIVYLPAHDALNIEHGVANSWWGGKSGSNEAYCDLFHLTPSDQNANNTKSNNPFGETIDARLFDNGMSRIGTPVEGQGGGSATVFEPADEYKGDFARAIFYVFSAYPDIPWIQDETHAYMYDESNELQPWAVEMLLRWHYADPVDSKEINRNQAVYELQNNRNPFIDHPELIDYLWGDKKDTACALEAVAAAIDRPEAPVFPDFWLTGINTYTHRWWDGFPLDIKFDGGTLMLSIDGREYFESDGSTYIQPAADMNEAHVYRAYVKANVNGHELRSSVATLNLQPLNPDEVNYSCARWEKIDDNADLEDDTYYLLLSSNTLHAMSTTGGVPSKGFMESVGFVKFDDENRVVEIPANTAVLKLESAGEGKHRLMINNTCGEYLGSWNATAKNQMRIKSDEFTPATASFKGDGSFIFTFDQYGSLQFNKTQPRFLNYESNQTPVYLYKFLDFNGGSGIENVTEDTPWGVGVNGNEIIVDGNTRIFDLSGRPVKGSNLPAGFYIVVGQQKTTKIMIK